MPVKIHLILIAINFIYSLNYILVKNLTPKIIGPFGLQICRVIGAIVVFNLFYFLFAKKEKVPIKDLLFIAFCSIFGIACNGLFFLKGISQTSPINTSLIIILVPIFVLILSYFILNEKINYKQFIGLLLGLFGAAVLITKLQPIEMNSATAVGDFFILLNALSFAVYFILARRILKKYSPITMARWLFIFGLPFVLPFGYSQFSAINWSQFTTTNWLLLTFVIIFPTCVAYYLYNVALKNVPPTISSIYIFSQPLFTTILTLLIGDGKVFSYQLFGGLLILIGVYLVTFYKSDNILTQ